MPPKKSEIRVRDLMKRDVIAVHPDDPLSEALALMFEHRVSAVPVVDRRERCKGILSTTDLVALWREWSAGGLEPDELEDLTDPARLGLRLGSRKVAEAMTPEVMTVGHEDPLPKAAREMLRHRVHRLVVVDAQQRVIGILSTMDLLEAYAAAEATAG